MAASFREVAKLAGVSANAISKAVKKGRISVDENGKIPDAEKAVAEFLGSRDPSKVRDTGDFAKPIDAAGSESGGLVMQVLNDDEEDQDGAAPDDPAVTLDAAAANRLAVRYLREKTEKTAEEKHIARLKRQELAKSLISRDQTLKQVAEMAGTFRAGMINFPDRYGLQIANELGLEPRDVIAVLEKHIRAHLTDLADVVLNLPD